LLTGQNLREKVSREIFAVESAPALLQKLGKDVRFHCLETFSTCTSSIAVRPAA
jgi:hypothetical protein